TIGLTHLLDGRIGVTYVYGLVFFPPFSPDLSALCRPDGAISGPWLRSPVDRGRIESLARTAHRVRAQPRAMEPRREVFCPDQRVSALSHGSRGVAQPLATRCAGCLHRAAECESPSGNLRRWSALQPNELLPRGAERAVARGCVKLCARPVSIRL